MEKERRDADDAERLERERLEDEVRCCEASPLASLCITALSNSLTYYCTPRGSWVCQLTRR